METGKPEIQADVHSNPFLEHLMLMASPFVQEPGKPGNWGYRQTLIRTLLKHSSTNWGNWETWDTGRANQLNKRQLAACH